MTPSEIEAAIISVAEDPGLHAMKLFGEWGTGKTYFVRDLFTKKEILSGLKGEKLTYAYVSLFGISSIAEVRRRLCVAALATGAGGQLKNAVAKARTLLSAKVGLPGLEIDLSKIGDLAAEIIEDRALRRLFVCFDDLERTGSSLNLADILGLVAELSENRDCRILVLFNDSKLGDAGRAALKEYDEKIFDLSVEYKPTIAHNLRIGFEDAGDRELVRGAFEVFGNANIRIMKRVGWMLRKMRDAKPPHIQEN